MAALGIGGEWAVGASLLSETWPKRWRLWLAAVLQSAVNIGVLVAAGAGIILAGLPNRYVFLIGVAPAILVLWIRRHVPETEQWHAAKENAQGPAPDIAALFGPKILRTTLLTIAVCSLSLTAHWAFMFWYSQQYRELLAAMNWTDADQKRGVGFALVLVMTASIAGNFLAAAMAKRFGYRGAIALLCLMYFGAMVGGYCVPRGYTEMQLWIIACGVCQGVFALFTMYLPPLFPTLIRTTGAGFCYNIGRLAAAAGTVYFGTFATVDEIRPVLLYASVLFLPAAAVALMLPEPPDETAPAPNESPVAEFAMPVE